jgi:hypothetical protein
MLPRELHLEQINRYHDTIDKLNLAIDSETDENKKKELSFKWYKLFSIWNEIDDLVEFTIKHKLDCAENDDLNEL